MGRLRTAPKAPLAVAGVLATPLFFMGLMAVSLAVEKPSVRHVLRHGRTVRELGDPSGTTEAEIWLIAFAVAAAVIILGAAAMLIGRAGVAVSSVGTIAATIALLVPLGTWTSRHTGRYPDGVDLIPRSAGSEDIYLRGEWEASARRTAEQLGIATIVLAALAIAIFALFEVRRRRGLAPPAPPPPPEIVTGGPPAGW